MWEETLMKASTLWIEKEAQEWMFVPTDSTIGSLISHWFFSLIDLPLTNLRHTWANFRPTASCSKIDRFFVSKEWLERNPSVHLKGLPRPVSDHCPLFLSTEGLNGGPTPLDSKICGSNIKISKILCFLGEIRRTVLEEESERTFWKRNYCRDLN